MGVPKQKTTRSRKGTRRSHLAINSFNLTRCSYCNQLKAPHAVCKNCGRYKNEQVIEIKEKTKSKQKDAK